MTFIKSIIVKVLVFIFKSSADPKTTSLTVKFALVGTIPYLMQLSGLACQWGQYCYSFNPGLLEIIATSLADGVFYSLSLVAIFGGTYGALRKGFRTFIGENEALNN